MRDSLGWAVLKTGVISRFTYFQNNFYQMAKSHKIKRDCKLEPVTLSVNYYWLVFDTDESMRLAAECQYFVLH